LKGHLSPDRGITLRRRRGRHTTQGKSIERTRFGGREKTPSIQYREAVPEKKKSPTWGGNRNGLRRKEGEKLHEGGKQHPPILGEERGQSIERLKGILRQRHLKSKKYGGVYQLHGTTRGGYRTEKEKGRRNSISPVEGKSCTGRNNGRMCELYLN